jgi:sugar O-acyltransferase (sialic acid O-acetyltransferase NeuD family)
VTQSLIILGAGGNAYDVLDIVETINAIKPSWNVAGFLDDSPKVASHYLGLKVLGGLRDARKFANAMFISTIRNERSFQATKRIFGLTGLNAEQFATLVHPAAGISSRAALGRGVYVCYGASIGGGATLGDHVSVGPGCIVGHDSIIDEHSILAAGAIVSGGVQIASNCYVGSGAMIRQNLRIGTGALVGLGAVVVKDVEAGAVAVGNPARELVRSSAMSAEEVLGVSK